jgi:hypothetical protein
LLDIHEIIAGSTQMPLPPFTELAAGIFVVKIRLKTELKSALQDQVVGCLGFPLQSTGKRHQILSRDF